MAERLDRSGSLDDHSGAGRTRESGDERNRRGQDQRTWGGDHHDGECAFRIPADRPGKARHQDGGRQEEPGVAVGHAHEWRALGLRLLDQPHERRVGAVARWTVGPDVERGARVGRSAQHGHALPQGLGKRLAAERARVHDGLVTDHGAVDRNDLAGPDQDHVTRLNPVHRDLLESVVDSQLRDLWSALNERGQLTARPSGGNRLE